MSIRGYTTRISPWIDRTKNDLALWQRRRFYELFMQTCAPTPDSKVADFGVTGEGDHPVHHFFEALYPNRHRLYAIGRKEENAAFYAERFPGLNFVEADLRKLPFPDLHFDAGLCNAVIEHAGDRAQQAALVHEVCRVSKRVMFTTPNKTFPVELHTFLPVVHWLPGPAFRGILRAVGHDFLAQIENLNPLSAADLLALFPQERTNRLIPVGTRLLQANLVCVSYAPGHSPAHS
jgi:SAM-dependent methyltransferase